MTVCQLDGPSVTVTRHSEDADTILVRFVVNGSTFGPVLVRLSRLEAAKLSRDLWALVGT